MLVGLHVLLQLSAQSRANAKLSSSNPSVFRVTRDADLKSVRSHYSTRYHGSVTFGGVIPLICILSGIDHLVLQDFDELIKCYCDKDANERTKPCRQSTTNTGSLEDPKVRLLQYIQCWLSNCFVTTHGPKLRAGLSEPPV